MSSRAHKEGSGEKFHQDSEDDFVDNDNDNSSDETEKSNDDQSNNGRCEDGTNYSYFLDQFHDQMDWYHVLNAHSNYSEKLLLLLLWKKESRNIFCKELQKNSILLLMKIW